MKQADEIIQEKEWSQLSADETAVLAGLADNEAEFNLLKQMLRVSAEAVSEVPAVNDHVYQVVAKELLLPKRRSIGRYWYAAAAAVVVVMLSLLFLSKREDAPGYVNIPKTPVVTPPPVKEISPIQQDSVQLVVEKNIIRKSPDKRPRKKTVFPQVRDDHPNNFVAVNTMVSENSNLLELITEVE